MASPASVFRASNAWNPKSPRVAHEHAEQQFAEHGGLIHALEELAADLGGQKNGDKTEQERRDSAVSPRLGAVTAGGERRNGCNDTQRERLDAKSTHFLRELFDRGNFEKRQKPKCVAADFPSDSTRPQARTDPRPRIFAVLDLSFLK